MATFRYFTTCNGEQVQLQNVWHSGQTTRADSFTGTCPACGQKHTAQRKIEMKAFPSRHECNAKCMGASGRSMVCECKCGGKNHGVSSFTCAAVAA
jgi:hypothetical protein